MAVRGHIAWGQLLFGEVLLKWPQTGLASTVLHALLQSGGGRMAQRLLAAGAAFTCVAILAAFSASMASADLDPAGGSRLHSVTALSGQSEQHLTIPIMRGLQPARLTATISVMGRTEGVVRLSVAGRVLLEASAAAKMTVDSVLTPDDATGRKLVLGLLYIPGTRNVCEESPSSATLGGVAVIASGSETVPATVAEFLSLSVPAILLPVPNDPSGDVSAGIMAASAALGQRYSEARIHAVPESETVAQAVDLPAGSRIIRVVDDTGNVTTSVTNADGRPTLVLAGNGEQLRMAALALASENLALADDTAVTRMTTSLRAAAGLERSLSALGASSVKISGYGSHEAFVGVRQSQFGGPVSSVAVRIKGTHTAIPAGGQAAVSVYWNDYLISSRTLEGDRFEVNADVPSAQIQARNGLRVRLTALPTSGDCTGPASIFPMEMTLDTTGSTVTGVRGHSVAPGFHRFPQVLGNSLPVAFDGGAPNQVNTLNAATLVAALQRDADGLLDVRKVDAASLIESSDSGLVVGATPDTASRLSAPLRLDEFRALDSGDLHYGVGTNAPYGVLEAFEQNGRNLLMLGGWSPDSDVVSSQNLQRSLTRYVQEQDAGWAALSRSLLVTQKVGEPVMLEGRGVIPQAAVTDSYRPYALWLLALLAVLGLALLLRTWLSRRLRSRALSYADAKQSASAEDKHAD